MAGGGRLAAGGAHESQSPTPGRPLERQSTPFDSSSRLGHTAHATLACGALLRSRARAREQAALLAALAAFRRAGQGTPRRDRDRDCDCDCGCAGCHAQVRTKSGRRRWSRPATGCARTAGGTRAARARPPAAAGSARTGPPRRAAWRACGPRGWRTRRTPRRPRSGRRRASCSVATAPRRGGRRPWVRRRRSLGGAMARRRALSSTLRGGAQSRALRREGGALQSTRALHWAPRCPGAAVVPSPPPHTHTHTALPERRRSSADIASEACPLCPGAEP